jgi:hypothetical protein
MYELLSARIEALWGTYYRSPPGDVAISVLEEISELEDERMQYTPAKVYDLSQDY